MKILKFLHSQYYGIVATVILIAAICSIGSDETYYKLLFASFVGYGIQEILNEIKK
jgi:hypothetical protein